MKISDWEDAFRAQLNRKEDSSAAVSLDGMHTVNLSTFINHANAMLQELECETPSQPHQQEEDSREAS